MAAVTPLKLAGGETQQLQTGDFVNNSFLSFMYLLQNLQTNVKVWTGTATTVSGVATFNPTSDNTATGTALFTTIFAIQATSINNTANAIQIGMCEVKAVAVGNKTITVNCIQGTTVVLGGASTTFVPDGRTIYLTIFGK